MNNDTSITNKEMKIKTNHDVPIFPVEDLTMDEICSMIDLDYNDNTNPVVSTDRQITNDQKILPSSSTNNSIMSQIMPSLTGAVFTNCNVSFNFK